MEKKEIRVIPVVGIPIIKSNDNLALHILEAAKNQNLELISSYIFLIIKVHVKLYKKKNIRKST